MRSQLGGVSVSRSWACTRRFKHALATRWLQHHTPAKEQQSHARTRVLALADEHQITIVELTTAEVLSRHQIDPDRGYWRNQNKEPGRWPDSQN